MSLPYLILLTILGWGIGSLCYKPANDAMHPIMVTTTVTVMYVLLTPLAFLLLKFDKTVTWSGIGYSALGGALMAIGSFAYFFALKKGGAGEITTVTALYPALTLVLSMIILHEELTWRKGVGVLLALVSVLVLSWK
jgi:drug/metabolite transporter (DMT)-like permease